jgi:hypothetical protein
LKNEVVTEESFIQNFCTIFDLFSKILINIKIRLFMLKNSAKITKSKYTTTNELEKQGQFTALRSNRSERAQAFFI